MCVSLYHHPLNLKTNYWHFESTAQRYEPFGFKRQRPAAHPLTGHVLSLMHLIGFTTK